MLSKNKIKFLRSLQSKKAREIENCYIAEGDRIVNELLSSNCKIIEIIALAEWIEENNLIIKGIPYEYASKEELNSISSLTSPQKVLCVVQIHDIKLQVESISQKLVLALDKIQDPGNMGTIIRLANWFGIEDILCSNDCVDIYNPKVIQATMGAITKVNIYYCDLGKILKEYTSLTNKPIYGTFLEGENIYTSELTQSGIIVLGNEGNGISSEIEQLINTKITIPNFSNTGVVESLNVSIAASIVCSEFKRRYYL